MVREDDLAVVGGKTTDVRTMWSSQRSIILIVPQKPPRPLFLPDRLVLSHPLPPRLYMLGFLPSSLPIRSCCCRTIYRHPTLLHFLLCRRSDHQQPFQSEYVFVTSPNWMQLRVRCQKRLILTYSIFVERSDIIISIKGYLPLSSRRVK